jgi:hypothetical protein
MAIGRTLTKAELDNATGSVVSSLYATMDNVDKIAAVLDGYTSAQLVSAGLCVDTTDGDRLKSAWTDLKNLSAIWRGSAATGTMPRDHRAFAKFLLGTGLY